VCHYIVLYKENKTLHLSRNCNETLLFFQGRFIFFLASYRSYESRDIIAIRVKFAKSRGSQSEHCARHVFIGTNYHSGHPGGNPPDRHRIFIGNQKAGDPMHLCVSRGDRQLYCLHDVLSGLFITYTRGISNLMFSSK